MEQMVEEPLDEINLIDYLRVLTHHKALIISIVVIVVAATAIVSLLMTPIYEAKAVIIPAGVTGRDAGPANFLATQYGIAPPTTPISAELVNTLKSNTLKEKIITRYNLFPVLLDKNYPEEKDSNKLMWKGIRSLQAITKINFVQKDNIVEVSVQFKDPKIAADIVNYTLAELNDYMSSEAKRVANTNRKYLESQIDKQADPFIKAKLYGLIAQQVETAMMSEVKENFAFKVLDSPRVPDQNIKPKKKQMVMIAFIVSLFLGIFMAFGKEYVDKQRLNFRRLGPGDGGK